MGVGVKLSSLAQASGGWAEVEQADFGGGEIFHGNIDDGHAAVVDAEVAKFGEGQIHQHGEDRADDAAMAEDGGTRVAGCGEEFLHTWSHPFEEPGGGFAVREAWMVEDVQPVYGRHSAAFAHLLPIEAGEVAEVHFAQPVEEDWRERQPRKKRGHRVPHAEHGTGKDGVDFPLAEPVREGVRVPVAGGREIHVHPRTAEDALPAVLDFTMSDEVEADGAGRVRFQVGHLMMQEAMACPALRPPCTTVDLPFPL